MKKSIIINQIAHKELTKLSESLSMQYGNLVEAMIFYFKKTGINPKDAINQNPSVMVKALDKRIVSFLKVQERDILIPLRKDVFEYQKELKSDIYNYQKKHEEETKKINSLFFEVLNKMNKIDSDRTKIVNQGLQKNEQAILTICELIDIKNKTGIQEKLKSIFK